MDFIGLEDIVLFCFIFDSVFSEVMVLVGYVYGVYYGKFGCYWVIILLLVCSFFVLDCRVDVLIGFM